MTPDKRLPLGVVHNDDYRERLMLLIQKEKDAERLSLWGRCSRSNKIEQLPTGIDLNWMGGEGRELNANPAYPDLKYYCDVTASWRPQIKSTPAFVIIEAPYTGESRLIPTENRGDWTPFYSSVKDRDAHWTEVEISKAKLNELRVKLVKAPDRPTNEEVKDWMKANVTPASKRDQTISDCRTATGATYRQARNAWTGLPADQKRKRGQKSS